MPGGFSGLGRCSRDGGRTVIICIPEGDLALLPRAHREREWWGMLQKAAGAGDGTEGQDSCVALCSLWGREGCRN